VISNLVYSANGHNVDSTIVDGKVIMKDRTFLTLNENTIYDRTGECARKLAEQLG